MPFGTLVQTDVVAAHLTDASWVFADCRFSLGDTARGRRDYLEAHIPGATYFHLDEDLSATPVPGRTGRHPLPPVPRLQRLFSARGISAESQVVCYDDMGGAIAARLWWMLRWLGHDAVAVLDGGWQAWLAGNRPVRVGEEQVTPAEFVARPRPEMLVGASVVAEPGPGTCVIDARGPQRYRGEEEPIDPVAGHIPGAINLPFAGNMIDGRFRPAEALRARYMAATSDTSSAIVYCGSGVTAAHDLLAMVHAGLPMGRLYAGSWSDWITDPNREIATGESP